MRKRQSICRVAFAGSPRKTTTRPNRINRVNNTKPLAAAMIPPNPEIHDYVMSESDDRFIALRQQHPALDEAIGELNFSEIRDGNTPNTYSVVLLLPSLMQCIGVKKYADLIIKAHQTIDSSVLESIQIVYLMPNYRHNGYSEQLFFSHTFGANHDHS